MRSARRSSNGSNCRKRWSLGGHSWWRSRERYTTVEQEFRRTAKLVGPAESEPPTVPPTFSFEVRAEEVNDAELR
eukprot:1088748-Pyramimonas_sp.AAC.1